MGTKNGTAMTETPFQDWEATLLARTRRMGLSASVRGEHSHRTIIVTNKDGGHCFDVLLRQKGEGFVAGIVRPDDQTIQGLPHATDHKGVLQAVGSRIAHVGPSYPYGGEKLLQALATEIEWSLGERPHVVPGSTEECEQAAERLVDLASGDPKTAKVSIANALAEVLSPEALKDFFEALDRHVEAVPQPGMR